MKIIKKGTKKQKDLPIKEEFQTKNPFPTKKNLQFLTF